MYSLLLQLLCTGHHVAVNSKTDEVTEITERQGECVHMQLNCRSGFTSSAPWNLKWGYKCDREPSQMIHLVGSAEYIITVSNLIGPKDLPDKNIVNFVWQWNTKPLCLHNGTVHLQHLCMLWRLLSANNTCTYIQYEDVSANFTS